MLKSNGLCLLSRLPGDLNLYDMANALGKENNTNIFTDDYRIKIKKSLLRKEDRRNLGVEMRSLCDQNVLVKTEDKGITKEIYEKLLDQEENVVVIGQNYSQTRLSSPSHCWIQVPVCTSLSFITIYITLNNTGCPKSFSFLTFNCNNSGRVCPIYLKIGVLRVPNVE